MHIAAAAPAATTEAPAASTAASTSLPPPITQAQLKVALCQLQVGSDKRANLASAAAAVARAAAGGASIVVLPEMFVCPYTNDSFGPYSETLPDVGGNTAAAAARSPTHSFLTQLAAQHGVYLVAGSVPERVESSHSSSSGSVHASAAAPAPVRLYNTCLVYEPSGSLIAKHRKMHLFDINVPGKQVFRESDVLSPGKEITTFDTTCFGRIGVAICYDVRFPELSQLMAGTRGDDDHHSRRF